MKICYYGNSGNVGYQTSKWLRARGLDVDLYMREGHQKKSRPEWEDPEVEGNYPDWVKVLKSNPLDYIIPPRSLKKVIHKYDIVLSTGSSILPAMSLGKPLVFIPEGSDITRLPFVNHSLKRELRSFFYRRNAKKIDMILTVQENCVWAAKLLGIIDKLELYPLLVDANKIRGHADPKLLTELKAKYQDCDLVFMAPARKNIDPAFSSTYKGVEKILYALQRFKKERPEVKFKLVSGTLGRDADRYAEMIHEMGLDENTDFVAHLPWPEWFAYLNLPNAVVFDQFDGTQNLGGIEREAMTNGALLITACEINSKAFLTGYGPDCPLYYAHSVDDICRTLNEMADMTPEQKAVKGEQSKQWIDKYLHWESRIDQLVGYLEAVLKSKQDNTAYLSSLVERAPA